MIVKISDRILKYIIKSEGVEQGYEDYYRYGIEITVSSIFNLVLVFSIGLITCSFLECLIFLISFVIIRQFTGGFHAPTYFWCNVSMCVVLLMVLFAYRFIPPLNIPVAVGISLCCTLGIALKCPVENENKPIPHERIRIYKLLSISLSVMYGLAGTLLISFGLSCGTIVIYTLCAVVILIIPATVMKRRCKNEKA